MSAKQKSGADPLASRIEKAVERIATLKEQVEDLQLELGACKDRLSRLESQRGVVRQRVQQMLEYTGG